MIIGMIKAHPTENRMANQAAAVVDHRTRMGGWCDAEA
jgi:hypothetical protein